MLPGVSLEISGTTMLELLRYLEKRYYHTDKPARDAADHAILEWVRAQHAAETITPVVLGYRWKNLFLPAGTRLEVSTRHESFRATVEGNEILFRGQAVSPNQFVATCAGAARNAWREVSLQMPGVALARRATPGGRFRCRCRANGAGSGPASCGLLRPGRTGWHGRLSKPQPSAVIRCR